MVTGGPKLLMFNCMRIKLISIFLSAVVLLLGNGFMEWCYPEEDAKKPAEVQTGQKPETVAVPGTIVPDSAGGSKCDAGIDLVVSKVEIARGSFEGERKIQITPYVKNMW